MSEVVRRTEAYYDSTDADEFYYRIWGGEDIHVGLYEPGEKDIFAASRRTVETMAGNLADMPEGTRVLDIGAGYGGAGRYLARRHGFHVTCLNLSKVQNQRNREMNEEQNLADKLDVVDGNFEDLPFESDSFDVIWSQDAILHSGDRFRVFEEADRVLKPGGRIVITDPMQANAVSLEELKPVLDRIHLETMGSIENYTAFAEKLGWEVRAIDRRTEHLVRHYSAVLANLEDRAEDLNEVVSSEYLENMKRGLRHWIAAGKAGRLEWGILSYRKAS